MSGQETSTKKLDRFLQRVRDRYAPSAALRALLKYGKEDGLTSTAFHAHVVDCVGLPDQLVRLLRTPIFQVDRPITTLEQSFERFDLGALHRLSVGLRLPYELQTALDSNFQKTIWRTALIRAAAAAEFEPDAKCDAVALALLPASGVFVLAHELGRSYIDFLDRIIAEQGDWRELEQQSLDFNHRAAEKQLLPYWGVPDGMTLVWELSHVLANRRSPNAPFEEPIPQLSRSLYLADLLTDVLTLERPDQFDKFISTWETHGDGSLEKLDTQLVELTNRVAALADALHIPFEPHPTLHELYCRVRTSREEAKAESDDGLDQVLAESRSLAKLAQQAKGDPNRGKALPGSNAAKTNKSGRATAVCVPVELARRIDTAISECRQTRSALSFVLLEVQENSSQSVGTKEHSPSHLAEQIHKALKELTPNPANLIALGPTQWAVVMCGFDKRRSVDAARDLMSETREWSRLLKETSRPVFNLSVGIASLALPPKNFPSQEMLDAAERCLSAARGMESDGLKSIDL